MPLLRILLCASLLVPARVVAAPHCTKGILCGNSCISASKTCHVGGGDPFVPTPPKLPPPRSQAIEPELTPSSQSPAVSSPFDDDPTEVVSPGPPTTTGAQQGSSDPCGDIPEDLDHATELRACRERAAPPAVPVPSLAPIEEVERAPALRPRRRSSRAEYQRGVSLEETGTGLVVAGVLSAIAGVALIVGGVFVHRADVREFVNNPSESGPKRRGSVMLWSGTVALVPLAHGLTIPGAFMLVRGRNLQRRAEIGVGSVKFRF